MVGVVICVFITRNNTSTPKRFRIFFDDDHDDHPNRIQDYRLSGLESNSATRCRSLPAAPPSSTR